MTKILLVEDDKSLREIYGVRLLAEGYDIISAGDGEEALAVAIKDRPALIVSDVMMPKISGFDMLDILRSTTETKDIKVIMMTALSSEDQRKRGEQLGADRYLVKSQVGIEDVVRTVHEVLGDAPVSAGNPFVAKPEPAPQAPANPTAPATPAAAAPASVPTATAPRPATPLSAPTRPVQTISPSAPVAPTPTLSTAPAAAPASSLPQPTAPFSTPRPGSLADRVIQPIEKPSTDQPPVSDLMDKELAGHEENPFLPPQPTPPTPPPVSQPTPTPQVAVPTPTTAPVVNPAAPFAPPSPDAPSELKFEETPITPSTPPSPQPPIGT